MLEKIDYNCLNCGAPINRFKMKCEYCGTEYKRGVDDKLVVFDRHIPNTDTFHCAARVDGEAMMHCPEKAMEIAKKRIASGLAKSILDRIEFTTRSDPCSFSDILEGRVTIVNPKAQSPDLRKYAEKLEYESKRILTDMQREELRSRLLRM